ncbi:DUF2339 domain-containing protein [Solibacillus sp. MA9]|uniref:DUF2339 domain-containing protein n=1 Tax=Solibacillus palustris TaxID=2908203 RepID=A0ABS9UF35_9BACL|nr:DUF2339 domain-containing protein [Solibacillus sp. MA9]MCH7322941.1 DUF2339 domain-containing protein [Solibacillus sp. MA9]
MENDSKLLERIATLERELHTLRTEVQHLKEHVRLEQIVPIKKEVAKTIVLPKQPVQKETSIVQEKNAPKKEKRSLEETFTRALPRIFMVILVLGVLWGLKLVSDYGFLSDSIKIIGGFALSIGLGICAFMMEKRQKGSRVVALSLYGGAFIVGILVTAAGAILYDVLNLYVALIIAIVYIAYGVWISYVKGNEALTTLVIFTSLLLPYLLEYMKFSALIIGVFIVLLFAVVQVVIWKHTQRKALYIGMAFSILAFGIVFIFHSEQNVFFALAVVTLYTVFLGSFLRLYSSKSKKNASMLFSFTIIILSLINVMLLQKEVTLLMVLVLLLGILASSVYIVFKREDRLLIDMFGTLFIITILNFIAQLNISSEVMLLLMITVSFAGMLLALKHTIVVMKYLQGITFSILSFLILVFYTVQPFFSIEHLTIVVVTIMLFVLYWILRHYEHSPIEDKKWLIGLEDVYPCLLYVVALLYIWKLDWTYMPLQFTSYFLFSAIAIGLALTLIGNRTIIGRLLPVLATGIYGFAALVLMSTVWIDERAITVAFIMRILYIAIYWFVIADLWGHGRIHKNYEPLSVRYTEQFTFVGMIISIIWLINFTHFMNFNELINWSTAVILNTVSIFIIACLALFLAAKRSYRQLKLTGIILLFSGIIKMIFFDLSELDILIRSILFILIGAIGLVISNKLLGKGKTD